MFPVHDNEIISYNVDLSNSKIIIHTRSEKSKYIDIVFSDVLVHYFENELRGSIILDIGEYNISSLLRDYDALFKSRARKCWPIWYKTKEELEEKLIKEQYCRYGITPSYGLGGWILAKNHEVISKDES